MYFSKSKLISFIDGPFVSNKYTISARQKSYDLFSSLYPLYEYACSSERERTRVSRLAGRRFLPR